MKPMTIKQARLVNTITMAAIGIGSAMASAYWGSSMTVVVGALIVGFSIGAVVGVATLRAHRRWLAEQHTPVFAQNTAFDNSILEWQVRGMKG